MFRREFQQAGRSIPVTAHDLGDGRYRVDVGDNAYEVMAVRAGDGSVRFSHGGRHYRAYSASIQRAVQVRLDGATWLLRHLDSIQSQNEPGGGAIEAPMTGTVLKVLVREGETVLAGQDVVLLSAMKMEHRLEAGVSGVVAEVNVEDGQIVEQGSMLARIEVRSEG